MRAAMGETVTDGVEVACCRKDVADVADEGIGPPGIVAGADGDVSVEEAPLERATADVEDQDPHARQVQFRISGRSWPCSRIYAWWSINLSVIS